MSRKVRVPIHRTSPTQSVLIDPAATNGAQFGVNLLDPAGNLVRWPIVAPPASGVPSLNTTDDLDEGQWNRWFTDERARDAVGAILVDSANVTLRYVDAGAAAGTITADLTALADTGGGTLQRTAFDAYGRKTGSSAATTTDLDEGTNLYFTDARTYTAAKALLIEGTNVTITADDVAKTLTISAAGGGSGGGDLYGPASATDGAVALFDGSTGKLLKDGVVLGTAATTAATDYATAAQGDLADSATQPGNNISTLANDSAFVDAAGASSAAPIQSLAEGTNITIDASDPANPIINATGGGAVDSVNGKTGVVVLSASDVGAATTVQGSTADSAVQPSDLATVATSGSYADLSGKPALGTAAATNSSAYATAAQGSKADSATQPGDNVSTLANDAGYIGDAPEDGSTYGRKNGAWDAVLGGAVDSVNGQTGLVVLDASDIGLGSVDNTSDADKPVSTAQAAAIAGKLSDAPSDGKDYVRENGAWVALTVKDQTGSATAPASGANQTSVAVTYPTAFATAPKVFITVTSGPKVGSGGLVSYLSAVPTTTGFTVYFDVAEGSGSPSTIDNPVSFDWLAKVPGVSGGGGGGGGAGLVSSATVVGSPASSITVSGLDIGSDLAYRVELSLKANTGTAGYAKMYINADTTDANYQSQSFVAFGSSTGASRQSDPSVCYLYGTSSTVASLRVANDPDGYPSFLGESRELSSGQIILRITSAYWKTALNITSLTVASSVSNAFAIGSSIKVYK